MDRHRRLLVAASTAVAIVLLIVAVALRRGEGWEYRVAAIPDGNFVVAMNALGSEGWELVTARRASDGTDKTFSYEVILKRRATASTATNFFAWIEDRRAREIRLNERVITDKADHTFHRPSCYLPTSANQGPILTAKAAIAAGWLPNADCAPLEP